MTDAACHRAKSADQSSTKCLSGECPARCKSLGAPSRALHSRLPSGETTTIRDLFGGNVSPRLTSTMILKQVDRADLLPLHEQVAAEIRRAIAQGEAGPGDRLPLAKGLATVLGVNKNTVLRALHVLRGEGLLEFRRGHGIRVSGTPERSAMTERVRDLLEFGRRHGYRAEEVVQIIEMVAGTT